MQLALAKSEKGEDYDLLYFDRNLDSEFTDETAVELEVSEQRGKIWSKGADRSLKLTHQLKDNVEIEGYADLRFWLAVGKGAVPENLRFSSKTCTEAKATLEGVEYEIVIQDFSNNAPLNDSGMDCWLLKGTDGITKVREFGPINRYFYGAKGKAWRIEVLDSSGLKANIYEVKPHMTKRELSTVNRKIKVFNPDTVAPVAKTPITFESNLTTALAKAKELKTSCL